MRANPFHRFGKALFKGVGGLPAREGMQLFGAAAQPPHLAVFRAHALGIAHHARGGVYLTDQLFGKLAAVSFT